MASKMKLTKELNEKIVVDAYNEAKAAGNHRMLLAAWQHHRQDDEDIIIMASKIANNSCVEDAETFIILVERLRVEGRLGYTDYQMKRLKEVIYEAPEQEEELEIVEAPDDLTTEEV